MVGSGKLPRSCSHLLFATSRPRRNLHPLQRWASGGKEAPFKVEVVDVQRRRSPWLLLGVASAGVGALYLKQQRDLQKDAETVAVAAAAEAELKAKEAAAEAAAEAEAAKAAALKAAQAEAEAAAREAEAAARARKAAEAEAKRQAAKQAALETTCLRCSQLLAEVSIIQDAAEYYSATDSDNEDLHALLSTLQAFVNEDAFKDLQQSQGEKSQLASKLLSSLAFLRLFVQRLQKADAAERQFDAAADSIRAERRRWLAGEAADLLKMEDGVAQAEAALVELESTGMKSDVLDQVIESARFNLREMKDEEQRRHTREVTGKALEAAMNTSSLDSKVCEQTAKDAVQAGCPPSAALEIAERVANIDNDLSIPKLYESIDPLSQPAVGPRIPSTDRRPEDYVSAAVAAKASMTEAQLIEHISQLAEALAAHHRREALELSGAWAAILPNWEAHSQEKTGKIQEEFTTRKKLGKETCETELKELAARRLQEALQDAVEEVQERSERDIYDLYSSTNLQLQEDLTGAIRSFDSYFRGLPQIFTPQVQELWNQGHCPQHRVAKASHSAATTLAADPAISCEELQRAFHRKLPELMAAAFEPGEHVGYVGSFIGKVFGRLYKIKGEQTQLAIQEDLESKLGAVPIDEGKDVHKNLRTLADALRLVERGEMRGALAALDGLAGQCRSRAEEWVLLARHTLLYQQASDAAKARMLCLGTTLVESA